MLIPDQTIIILLSSGCSAILAGVVMYALQRNNVSSWQDRFQKQLELTNELEKKLHAREIEFLAEKNRLEIELVQRLSDQKAELQKTTDLAVTEALAKQRAEYELQSKLFSIKISPYAQLITDNGFFTNTYESKIGYQYQLLVNGIPAFQPHVVIEHHEKIDQVDQSIKNTLLSTAQNCAEMAVSTYFGAGQQFVKLAAPIYEQINK